jgi:protein TonB
MMFDKQRHRRRAQKSLSLGALLLGLFLSATFASAQEAPRPEGSSQIKPPMIKPPMIRVQPKGGSVKHPPRRKKVTKRKPRAKKQVTTKREIVDIPVTVGNTGSAPIIITGVPSIKPPMANDEGVAPLNPTVNPTMDAPRAPISAGVLNGRAVSLPRPAYPAIARAARVSGLVVVQIIIDEEGKVVSASAISGHPLLIEAAVQAARLARFTPVRLEGQPVKVSGTLSYNFVLPPASSGTGRGGS